jgi:hypothetical protein
MTDEFFEFETRTIELSCELYPFVRVPLSPSSWKRVG